MRRSLPRVGFVGRAGISLVAIVAMAVAIVELPSLLPGSSRRTELMFVGVLLFMVAVWSLIDALIDLARTRRRTSGHRDLRRFIRK